MFERDALSGRVAGTTMVLALQIRTVLHVVPWRFILISVSLRVNAILLVVGFIPAIEVVQ